MTTEGGLDGMDSTFIQVCTLFGMTINFFLILKEMSKMKFTTYLPLFAVLMMTTKDIAIIMQCV